MQPPTIPFTGDSPQVRATVDRARAALEQGNLAEAAELFRAALAAGYTGADAVFLLGKALTGLGQATDATRVLTQVAGDPIWGNQARGLLDKITNGETADAGGTDRLQDAHGEPELGRITIASPLPLAPGLPDAVVRAIRDADADVAAGRYESALDLTLYAETLAPTYLPLFIRHAELLIATGRPQDALALASTITRLMEVRGDTSSAVDVARVVAHAAPTHDNVVALAQALLQAGDPALIARYLPAAIAIALRDEQPAIALDLAREWYRLSEQDPVAQYVYTRELLRTGWVDDAVEIAASNSDSAQLTVAALAAAVAAGLPTQWEIATRLLGAIRSGRFQSTDVKALLLDITGVLPPGRSLELHHALIALTAGNSPAALAHLRQYQPSERFEQFIAAVCASRAATSIGDRVQALPALRRAFTLVDDLEPDEIEAAAPLFDPPASPAALGHALATDLAEQDAWQEAAEIYRTLLQTNPGDAVLTRSYAEALGRTGQRTEALETLRKLFAEQEAAGQHAAALETLRTLVRIAPGNLPARNRLIDALMKRGRIDEAVGELFVFAQLLERAHRVPDAIAQLRRAVEISSLTSDWNKVDQLYSYMMQLQPEDIGLRHAAAATYLQSGQIDAALEQLKAVVRVSVTREDPDEAIAALHQIIALAPEDPDPYHRLGELLASVGEYGQAERVYRRLSTLLPDDPAVRAKQKALAALAEGAV